MKLAVVARDGGRCQADARGLVPEVGCGGRPDPHHIWPTGRGGPRLDIDNIVTLCRRHHDWAHAHPTAAKQKGLLR